MAKVKFDIDDLTNEAVFLYKEIQPSFFTLSISVGNSKYIKVQKNPKELKNNVNELLKSVKELDCESQKKLQEMLKEKQREMAQNEIERLPIIMDIVQKIIDGKAIKSDLVRGVASKEQIDDVMEKQRTILESLNTFNND